MERRIPKNVRQIGNVSDNPKIYVEDYVDTFFTQLCEKGKEHMVGAFLIGDSMSGDDQDFMFIHGAMQMVGMEEKDGQVVIGDAVWRSALKECKEYFGDASILGWFLCAPDQVMEVDDQRKKLHEKIFRTKSSLLVLKDSTTKEEEFYIYKYRDLMQLGGHYIYYEKNPSMQNYMISKRKQNGVTPSESVEDQAAKNFRSLINQKTVQKNGRMRRRLAYGTSMVLVFAMIAMGVSTWKKYEELKPTQSTVKQLSRQSSNEEQKESDASNPSDASADEAVDEQSDSKEAQGTETVTGTEDNSQEIPQGDEEPDASNQVYVVEEGDTLAIISTKQYGDISHVDAICRMNGLKNGNLIYEGQKLLLP